MKHRNKVYDHLLIYVAWIERSKGKYVKSEHVDNFKKFLGMLTGFRKSRIALTILSTYSP